MVNIILQELHQNYDNQTVPVPPNFQMHLCLKKNQMIHHQVVCSTSCLSDSLLLSPD